MKKWREYSEEDRRFVEANYLQMSDRAMAQAIGSSTEQVRRFRDSQALFKPNRVREYSCQREIADFGVVKPLCLHELKDLWRLYRQGKTEWELCQHFSTTPAHLADCLVVAEQLHGHATHRGWGMEPKDPEMVADVDCHPEPVEGCIEGKLSGLRQAQPDNFDAVVRVSRTTKKFTRPAAEYSNRSPYGIASPGLAR